MKKPEHENPIFPTHPYYSETNSDEIVNPLHKFNVNRKHLYEYDQPAAINERTKKRLIEMADLGMEEVGVAEFGVKEIMSGLYIERVWSYSDADWKSFMDWVRSLINEHTKKA